MRYRIEYLRETTEQETVSAVEGEGDLGLVEWQARMGGADARRLHGAAGFQIRDLADYGRIVALETFEEPLGYFDPHAGNHVIH